MLLITRTPLLPTQALGALPAWIWVGGAIGACLVLVATLLVPKIGAGALICLIGLGHLLGSLLFDHFAVLGPHRPADTLRIAGALLGVAAAAPVARPCKRGAPPRK